MVSLFPVPTAALGDAQWGVPLPGNRASALRNEYASSILIMKTDIIYHVFNFSVYKKVKVKCNALSRPQALLLNKILGNASPTK